jgi:integrase
MSISIYKRKDSKSYRCVVRHAGQEHTKTHPKHAVVRAWADHIVRQIDEGTLLPRGGTLGYLFNAFREEVISHRPHAEAEISLLKRLGKLYADVDVAELGCDWWLATVRGWKLAPSSRQRYMAEFAAMLTSTENNKRATVNWTEYKRAYSLLSKAGVIAASTQRDRRPTQEEIDQLRAAFQAMAANIVKAGNQVIMPMEDIMDFAITTSMRIGEIIKLKWADLNDPKRFVIVRDRKHPSEKIGNDQKIPLLGAAYEIANRQPKTSERIFPYSRHGVSHRFTDTCTELGIEDLVIHDLRHEGISRLFERGAQIHQVARVSGHRSWKSLKRYTQISTESLHDLDAKLPAWVSPQS